MAEFWEEFRKKVLEHKTSADVAQMVYHKVASTGVAGPAIIKPAFHLGQLSVLTTDFVDHVERLLEAPDSNWSAMMRSVCFVRECSRTMVDQISHAADPFERLITMVEEILEAEEFAAMDMEEEEAEGEEEAQEGEAEEEGEDLDEQDVEREEMAPERDKLRDTLRVKFRDNEFSDEVSDEMSMRLADVYLECVQFNKELARLRKAPEADTSAIMSILIDLQYGLDVQLRGLLVEDVNLSEAEPSFRLGLFTWSAHFLQEIIERLRAEATPASLTMASSPPPSI